MAANDCACCQPPWAFESDAAIDPNTPWSGYQANKLYLQSGQFTSTVLTSQSVTGDPGGIGWDGTNTPWTRYNAKLILTSGQFTSTIKTSETISGIAIANIGQCWDGTNTPWTSEGDEKMFLTSGQFTSTIKTSHDISALLAGGTFGPGGISFSDPDTVWSDRDKFWETSGQFSSTIKTSQAVTGPAADIDILGLTWDGTNTPWCNRHLAGVDDKMYLNSGKFTTTTKTSQSVSAIDDTPVGINSNKTVVG